MAEQDIFPVVVIGAGLAGLTAGLHLAARDVPPLILEADTEWAGGRLAGGANETFEYQGRTWTFSTQHGIHALWGGYDNMRAMLDRFLTLKLRPSAGEEWINRWGSEVRHIEAGTAVRRTWLPAPFHYLQLLLRPRFWGTITPLDFLSLPGFLVSLIWAMGLDPIREEIDLEGLTMQEFFRGWTPNLKATLTGLAHSLLAAPSEAITLTGFIAAMRFYTMTRRDIWHLDYLPGNSGFDLIQPMIDKIQGYGGMVMLGARAEELIRDGDSWRIRVADAKRGGTRTVIAKNVILAVEPPAAERLLKAGTATREAADRIKFPPGLPNATARLWFDTVPRSGADGGMFSGDFTIDNFFWLHRMHDEFLEWHQVTGGSAIEVHLYAPAKEFEKSDELLLIQATAEVQRAFPELRGHFVKAALRRNGATQSQFLVPTRKKGLWVETPWQGIYACGDWIGHPTPALWMERSVVTGIEAANHILRQHQQEPYPLIPARQPEALARGIGAVVRFFRKTIGAPLLSMMRLLRGKKRA